MNERIALPKAKARIAAWSNQIIVDVCPYYGQTHTHQLPIGEGQRAAHCLKGEYILELEG